MTIPLVDDTRIGTQRIQSSILVPDCLETRRLTVVVGHIAVMVACVMAQLLLEVRVGLDVGHGDLPAFADEIYRQGSAHAGLDDDVSRRSRHEGLR